MTDLRKYLSDNIILLDGGMGSLLQKAGLAPGELPERKSITSPELITSIHKSYYDAGSNIVLTNTFGANSLKFSEAELEEIVSSAILCAKRAANESSAPQPKWVALDIGPTGKMLKPFGDLDFEDAVSLFASVVKLGVKYGADLIFIETMSDSYETKAAVLAAKENSSLPIFVSNAYGEDGRLLTGATPEVMVAMLEGLGVDAIGANCSLGPKALAPIIKKYISLSSLPVILKPNAGMPRVERGKTLYDVSAEEFADEVASLIGEGVRIAGGCCGTEQNHISALTEAVRGITPIPLTKKYATTVCSYSKAVSFEEKPILIGERINPTGKRLFKEALRAGDTDYILKEAVSEEEHGADILDVNVGLPEIDEVRALVNAVTEIQAICPLPLQIDTSNPEAMEEALRRYNGKAMINSVNGKRESITKIFPLAKKYGGVIVCLTLDEDGIPESAEARVAIAEKIIAEAKKYGIEKHQLIFDPLALTVSTSATAPRETLKAVRMLTAMGCKTSLGVSNVSFGLPERDTINASFFTMAMSAGLSAAIMNPYSSEMMKAYHAYLALSGIDENCADYIKFASNLTTQVVISSAKPTNSQSAIPNGDVSELQHAIVKGLKERAAEITENLLCSTDALDIIEKEIIPALNQVGASYENKTLYLPSLLMSAEAAGAAFERIKARSQKGAQDKCSIVIATVKGDIHDIGKNIVKLLLENYGFRVFDLGKDVPPEEIASAAIKQGAAIVGLSALMTTTVPEMEKTVKLLRERAPSVKIMVGGAVLTKEYAEAIGADFYGKDAMEAVRFAQRLNESILKN